MYFQAIIFLDKLLVFRIKVSLLIIKLSALRQSAKISDRHVVLLAEPFEIYYKEIIFRRAVVEKVRIILSRV